MTVPTVLIVDDEPRFRRVLEMVLGDAGYAVRSAATAAEGLAEAGRARVDLVLLDLMLPDASGLDVLPRLRDALPDVPVVVMTAYGTIENAVEAMKLGAFDFLVKPFQTDLIEKVVQRAIAWRRSERQDAYLRDLVGEPFEGIIGRSDAMKRVFDAVERVAAAATTVLVRGETGVGKELVARAIHARSPRRENLFVAVNCAAIPDPLLEAELFGVTRGAFTGATTDRPGRFELADGGTLFLDEIGDMPLEMQAKFLRVLQEGTVERLGSNRVRHVDARVVAATHRDLEQMIRDKTFRADLYYRLAVVPIVVPPLRERRDDIAAIATSAVERFARLAGRRVRLADGALRALEDYDWPGNVRELHNVLERAVILLEGDVITAATLSDLLAPLSAAAPRCDPAKDAGVATLADAIAEAERAAIRAALVATGDNKARAAERLGISVRTLWYKLRRLGIEGEA